MQSNQFDDMQLSISIATDAIRNNNNKGASTAKRNSILGHLSRRRIGVIVLAFILVNSFVLAGLLFLRFSDVPLRIASNNGITTSTPSNNQINGIESADDSDNKEFALSQSANNNDSDSDGKKSKTKYGIVIDAGSSGSRIYIFQWTKAYDVVPTSWNKKIHPGVSSFANDPSQAGESLRPLMDYAVDKLSDVMKKSTPKPIVFFKATAGLRLLPADIVDEILQSIRKVLHEYDSIFDFNDDQAVVIPGVQEAVFSFITVNKLTGAFYSTVDSNNNNNSTDTSQQHLYGTVELGGASAQIAFIPDSYDNIPEEAKEEYFFEFDIMLQGGEDDDDNITTTIIKKFRPYVHSFLGYGDNQAVLSHYATLFAPLSPPVLLPYTNGTSGNSSSPNADNTIYLQNPCFYSGYYATFEIEPGTSPIAGKHFVLMQGTSDKAACSALVLEQLQTDAPCAIPNCSFAGVYQPSLPTPSTVFFGIDNFAKDVLFLQNMLVDGSSSSSNNHNNKDDDDDNTSTNNEDNSSITALSEIESLTATLCDKDWPTVQSLYESSGTDAVDPEELYLSCFYTMYVSTMLRDGFNFSSDANNNNNNEQKRFNFSQVIGQYDVSWTLGAMVYEVNRMAVAAVAAKSSVPAPLPNSNSDSDSDSDDSVTLEGQPSSMSLLGRKLREVLAWIRNTSAGSFVLFLVSTMAVVNILLAATTLLEVVVVPALRNKKLALAGPKLGDDGQSLLLPLETHRVQYYSSSSAI